MSKSSFGALIVAVLLAGCSPAGNRHRKKRGPPSKTAAGPSSAVVPRREDGPGHHRAGRDRAIGRGSRAAGLRVCVVAGQPGAPFLPRSRTSSPWQARAGDGRRRPGQPVRPFRELDALRAPSQPTDRESYAQIEENPVKRAAEQPVSTFSIDVDTGSYANVRRFLNGGRLPPRDAVRVEELVNYFDYDYPLPESRQPPFRVSTELAPTPWNPKTLLLAIGIKGYDLPKTDLPPANLVFLIDVSGSMGSPAKLDLLKPALKLLVRQLRPQDKVAIAVYAGAAGMVLEPTSGGQKAKIEAALDQLSAGGSTNGGAGIQLAYNLAAKASSRAASTG